jgi:hypothetical protein
MAQRNRVAANQNFLHQESQNLLSKRASANCRSSLRRSQRSSGLRRCWQFCCSWHRRASRNPCPHRLGQQPARRKDLRIIWTGAKRTGGYCMTRHSARTFGTRLIDPPRPGRLVSDSGRGDPAILRDLSQPQLARRPARWSLLLPQNELSILTHRPNPPWSPSV